MVLRRIFGGGRAPAPESVDPRDQLEAAVARRAAEYDAARLGMAEVATGRRRLELLVDRYREQVAELDATARTALAAGQEDAARRHLVRQAQLLEQIDGLLQHRAQIAGQLEQLRALSAQLGDELERLRSEKVAVLAALSAAEAQEHAAAVLASAPGGADPGALLAQARERAESLAIRAAADAEVAAASARGRGGEPIDPGPAIESRLEHLRGGPTGG